jgi:WD40 repeat protein
MTKRLVSAGPGPADEAGDEAVERISQIVGDRLNLSDDGRIAFARMQESPEDEVAKAAVIRALQFETDRDHVFAKTIQDLLAGELVPVGYSLDGAFPSRQTGMVYESLRPKRKPSALRASLLLGGVALILVAGLAIAAGVIAPRLTDSTTTTASSATTTTTATAKGWRSYATYNVRANDISFTTPWGDLLATADVSGTVSIWKTKTRKLIATLDSTNGTAATAAEMKSVAFNASGSRLVAGGERGQIEVWNVMTGSLVRRPFGNAKVLHTIFDVAFAPDGKTVASASQDGTVRIWDATTGEQLGEPISLSSSTNGNVVAANAVQFSPDGRLLATLADDGSVALWDPVTHDKVRSADSPATTVGTNGDKLAFSPDGKTLATVSAAGLHMWDTRTGRTITVSASEAIGAATFKGDGVYFATGGIDGNVRLYDQKTMVFEGTLPGDMRFVDAMAFSKSGPYLAAADAGSAVHLWTSEK